jgi:hypothetical protein
MSATSDGTLFLSISGQGTWKFNGQWQNVTTAFAEQIRAVNDNSFFCALVWSGGHGTYQYNNGSWHGISGELADYVGNDGSTFIGSLGYSTWIYQNGVKHKIGTPQAYEFG